MLYLKYRRIMDTIIISTYSVAVFIAILTLIWLDFSSLEIIIGVPVAMLVIAWAFSTILCEKWRRRVVSEKLDTLRPRMESFSTDERDYLIDCLRIILREKKRMGVYRESTIRNFLHFE